MEKLLGFYDTLNNLNTNSQFNVLLIIPVLTVFFGAILVFVCGFRKAEEPKFKKISDGTNNLNPSKSKAKKKANTNTYINNQNGNVIQKPNSNVEVLLKKLNSSSTKKQQQHQNKPGGVSSSLSPSSQQLTTSINASNKKIVNNAKKDNPTIKKSSNQQGINQQNISKSVSNKKSVADYTLKNKDEAILNKIIKKTKLNTNKNQALEGDGWQTVQSRTDKKNKKTENETLSPQSTPVVQQLNATEITVPGNATPKSPKKKVNDIKSKQITVSNTPTALKTSSLEDNTTDNNKVTELVDVENNQNLDNVQDNNKNQTALKQQSNQFSLPKYMTKEEFEEFVTTRAATTAATSSTDTDIGPTNDTEKMSPTIDNKSTVNTNEIHTTTDDNTTYHIQNKISDLNPMDILLNSSAVNQKKTNEKSSVTTKNTALSFIENEKLISELESKTNENVAFDELGDAWTETKTQKKNKKRVRKE